MGRFFLGVLTPILLVLVIILGLWVSDLVGLVKINNLALDMVSALPGMKNVKEESELGKKRSAVLLEKEDSLRGWESKLKVSQARLNSNVAQFENEKLEWEKQHPINEANTAGSMMPNKGAAKASVDPDLKKYLGIIGSMKPDKAATVIKQLPDDTVLLLLKQLRSEQATKILETLPSDYVVRLTKKRIKSSEVNSLSGKML